MATAAATKTPKNAPAAISGAERVVMDAALGMSLTGKGFVASGQIGLFQPAGNGTVLSQIGGAPCASPRKRSARRCNSSSRQPIASSAATVDRT